MYMNGEWATLNLELEAIIISKEAEIICLEQGPLVMHIVFYFFGNGLSSVGLQKKKKSSTSLDFMYSLRYLKLLD